MLRGLIAIALSLALQGGALSASLVHAHLDDHHQDHHGPRVVHAHFSSHHHLDEHPWKAGTDAWQADDDPGRVAYLQVFLAVHSETVVAPALPPGRFSLPTLHASVMRQSPEMVRSHGPPEGLPGESRAPPTSCPDSTAR
ncbi:MAG: hypothetical protein ACRD3C_26225 [Vicinamibacterales bacterium]